MGVRDLIDDIMVLYFPPLSPSSVLLRQYLPYLLHFDPHLTIGSMVSFAGAGAWEYSRWQNVELIAVGHNFEAL